MCPERQNGLAISGTTRTNSCGSGNALPAGTKLKENRSLVLSDNELERIAVAGYQAARELLPGKMESDEAFKLRVKFLKEIVMEVGAERYTNAIAQCIRTCGYRNEVTIARIRQEAGLSVAPAPSPAVEAWELVTEVVQKHVTYDAQGNAVLEPNVKLTPSGLAIVTPIPNLSQAIEKAVSAVGGWAALKESYPNWWTQKFQMFRDMFQPENSNKRTRHDI